MYDYYRERFFDYISGEDFFLEGASDTLTYIKSKNGYVEEHLRAAAKFIKRKEYGRAKNAIAAARTNIKLIRESIDSEALVESNLSAALSSLTSVYSSFIHAAAIGVGVEMGGVKLPKAKLPTTTKVYNKEKRDFDDKTSMTKRRISGSDIGTALFAGQLLSDITAVGKRIAAKKRAGEPIDAGDLNTYRAHLHAYLNKMEKKLKRIESKLPSGSDK